MGPHWGPFGPTPPYKKSFLHKQMTEKIAHLVSPSLPNWRLPLRQPLEDPAAREKLQKMTLLKSVFLTTWSFGGSYHVKFKSKISYLGEKISTLPWQMAVQLAVEVDVKNIT